MQRKLLQDIDMVQFHGEDFEIIRRLLALNHLFKWYVQLQTINLMGDVSIQLILCYPTGNTPPCLRGEGNDDGSCVRALSRVSE